MCRQCFVKISTCFRAPQVKRGFSWFTLQGTNISPQNGMLKMIFLFPRWDMLIPWRVCIICVDFQGWGSLHSVWQIAGISLRTSDFVCFWRTSTLITTSNQLRTCLNSWVYRSSCEISIWIGCMIIAWSILTPFDRFGVTTFLRYIQIIFEVLQITESLLTC